LPGRDPASGSELGKAFRVPNSCTLIADRRAASRRAEARSCHGTVRSAPLAPRPPTALGGLGRGDRNVAPMQSPALQPMPRRSDRPTISTYKRQPALQQLHLCEPVHRSNFRGSWERLFSSIIGADVMGGLLGLVDLARRSLRPREPSRSRWRWSATRRKFPARTAASSMFTRGSIYEEGWIGGHPGCPEQKTAYHCFESRHDPGAAVDRSLDAVTAQRSSGRGGRPEPNPIVQAPC
jgi:hypothetical protein